MAKTLQAILATHHKQSLLKKDFAKTNKEKLALVNEHEAIFSVNNEMDALMLDVYYQSTINKNTIQDAIESLRNQVFDMWPNLDNNQKNHLLQLELSQVFARLPQFEVQDTPIMVAFFDELLNALLIKRTAVFELPQFFKLYKSYKERVIDPKIYNHLPFQSGFSVCDLLVYDDTTMVVYHPVAKIVFELRNFTITKRLPFWILADVTHNELVVLAQALIKDDLQAVKTWCLTHKVLKSAVIKSLSAKNVDKKIKGI